MNIKVEQNKNIETYIFENKVPQAVDSFKCPFCKIQHTGGENEMKFYGDRLYREEDPGFYWKEVLICPVTKQEYWYLNGV